MTEQKELVTYVIAQRGTEFLDSPVFHAGPEQSEEAIAVFSSREMAEEYIVEADWKENYEVGQLRPVQVLKWFQTAHDNGADMVAINPDPSGANFSTREDVLSLQDPSEAFAQLLNTKMVSGS